MKTKLEAIYKELLYRKKIKNQTDLGDKLGYTKGYTSQIMNDNIEINEKIKQSFNEVFGVNIKYWDSETEPMFTEDAIDKPSDIKKRGFFDILWNEAPKYLSGEESTEEDKKLADDLLKFLIERKKGYKK